MSRLLGLALLDAKPTLLESPFLLGEKRGGEEYNHFEFRPSGYGVMNFPALMPLVLACNPEWITIDHDMSYERDNFEDMRMSLDYIRNLVSLCRYDTKSCGSAYSIPGAQ